jgi:AmiR/NasT family two-component response regulator
MSVHVIADTANKLATLRAMLEAQHTVTSELLSGTSNRCSTSDAIVATADLRVVENIAALKETFGKLGHVPKRIFLIDQRERLFTVQAYALGATCVLINPIKQANLLAQLADRNPSETHPNDALQGAREAAAAGAIAIGAMFSAVLSGKPIDVRGAKGAAGGIADSIAEDGLSSWLEAVRLHH